MESNALAAIIGAASLLINLLLGIVVLRARSAQDQAKIEMLTAIADLRASIQNDYVTWRVYEREHPESSRLRTQHSH